jgi:hypothetical protein
LVGLISFGSWQSAQPFGPRESSSMCPVAWATWQVVQSARDHFVTFAACS